MSLCTRTFEDTSSSGEKVKILITLFQMLNGTTVVFSIPYPDFYKNMVSVVTVDGGAVFRVEKLFDRVTPDECSWSVEGGGKGGDGGGVLVISMEKGEARPWAELALPGTALPGLTL